MTRKQKYLAFLESAAKSSPKNAELLGAVAAGFRACFEGEEDLSWENSDGISNEYLQKKLDEGVPPKELFTKICVGGDGLRPVLIGADDKYGDKWNFIDANNHLVSKIWFDAISGENLGNPFKGDPSVQEVELNGQWNIINSNGELLSDQWFDDIRPIGKKYGAYADRYLYYLFVKLGNKYNIMLSDGGLIFVDWVDHVYKSEDPYVIATVLKDGVEYDVNNTWKLINPRKAD